MSFKQRQKMWKPKIIKEDEESYECRPILEEFKTFSPPTRTTFKESFQCFSRYTKSLPRSIYNLGRKQSFVNFLLKFTLGFIGGIIITYFCFMFLVFQLSVTLVRAAIFSSGIGILMTLGLIFSPKFRCLSFLIIPQFFSRIGRYTLTCYALILILTGPAANTLRNSHVLSQSMSCGQDRIQTNVLKHNEADELHDNMMNAIKTTMDKLKHVSEQLRATVSKLKILVISLTKNIDSSITWLAKTSEICKQKFKTPANRCIEALKQAMADCKAKINSASTWLCDVGYVNEAVCNTITPVKSFCQTVNFNIGNFTEDVQQRFQNFYNKVDTMLHMAVYAHHPAKDIEQKPDHKSNLKGLWKAHDSDPILIWLCLSVGVTGIFFLLIIFRATYYQHMYETRTRFDNRYITREIQEINQKRLAENKQTILPLHHLEKANYINATSIHLVASERLYLSRSVLFMSITTFKLMIHVVADYSLYWVLMTIRSLGPMRPCARSVSSSEEKAVIKGQGPVAHLLKSVIDALHVPSLVYCDAQPDPCLPNPYPPDFERHFKIGFLILLLWFLALFEPYGLRLRHLIMGFYKPERAKIRAQWLYGHILKSRGGFMKFARRKLHRTHKYSDQEVLTFRYWIQQHVPNICIRIIFRCSPRKPQCLLCAAKQSRICKLICCEIPNCPGTYCPDCFKDLGQTCTICKSPADYGDFSDISLETLSDNTDNSGYSEDNNTEIDASVIQLRKKKKKAPKPKKYFSKIHENESDLDDNIINTQSLELLQQEYEEKVKIVKESTLNTNDGSFAKKVADISSESESDSLKSNKDKKAVNNPNKSKLTPREDQKKSFRMLHQIPRNSNTVTAPEITNEPSKSSLKPWNYRNLNFNIFGRLFKTLLGSYYKIKRSDNGSIQISKHKSVKSQSKISTKVQAFGPIKFFKNIWSQMRRGVPLRRKPSKSNDIICETVRVEDCEVKAFTIDSDSNPEEEITIFSKYDHDLQLPKHPQTLINQKAKTINKNVEEFSIDTETNKTDDLDDWWSAIIESGNTELKKEGPQKSVTKINAMEEMVSINRGKNVTFFKPSSVISEVSDESLQ